MILCTSSNIWFGVQVAVWQSTESIVMVVISGVTPTKTFGVADPVAA